MTRDTTLAAVSCAPAARDTTVQVTDLLPRPGGRSCGSRIAFYSHDTQGLGHVRRNTMLAAATVAADPAAQVLLVSGAREAASLPLPDRTRIVFVPELAKDVRGGYSARGSTRPLDHVVALRSAALTHALTAFAPDLLVVDKVPRGFGGELEPVVLHLRRHHGTRTVLGLRDVLDDIDTTRREWARSRTSEAVDALYDQVWVYGDPAVFDPAEEYGWGTSVRAKVRYTGYLGAGREFAAAAPDRLGAPAAPAARPRHRSAYVLALVGGGQDGSAVADAFARSAFPPGHEGVIVAGPYLPARDLARLRGAALERGDLQVHRLVSDVPALARGAAATVSMGGYNSVCELVAARRPALVVPRRAPRLEQAVRAERFEKHGLIDVMSLDDLGPRPVGRWLADAVRRPARPVPTIDLDGLLVVPALVADLLDLHADRTGRAGTGARHVG